MNNTTESNDWVGRILATLPKETREKLLDDDETSASWVGKMLDRRTA